VNELVIPASRLKLLGQFVAGLVFVALGLAMMFFPMRYGWWERFIGLVSVAFFGSVVLAILYRLVRPAPAITINAQGIIDNASGLSVGLIRWDEIDEVREYRVGKQAFLGIFTKDPDALIKKQPRWKRTVIRANLKMGSAPVNIPQAQIGMKLSRLADEIERRRPLRISVAEDSTKHG
jgi:hypothetical protein